MARLFSSSDSKDNTLGVGRLGIGKVENIPVHTMPQPVKRPEEPKDSSKFLGLLILLVGLILLVAGGVLIYWQFFKPTTQTQDNNILVESSPDNIKASKPTPSSPKDNQPPSISPPKFVGDPSNEPDKRQASSDSSTLNTKMEDSQVKETANNRTSNQNNLLPNTTPTSSVETEALNNNLQNLSVSASSSDPKDTVSSSTVIIATSSEASVGLGTISPKINVSPSDSDKDGLYDGEEAILHTLADNSDSDGDGYNDLTEVLGLYNPLGTGKILQNSNFSQYVNKKYGYSVIYPVAAKMQAINEDSLLFSLGQGNQIIQLVAQPLNRASLEEWYQDIFGSVAADNLEKGDGWQGIYSPNRDTLYFVFEGEDTIFSLSYGAVGSTAANFAFPNIYKMILNSLLKSKLPSPQP
ncbi:hypothetical protein D6821_02540 [Candidatus Parcubacteria bacterium]|nr:MAG: hypothetical protein D6821_02540 [Candidatus Parcubacteria bacterium]